MRKIVLFLVFLSTVQCGQEQETSQRETLDEVYGAIRVKNDGTKCRVRPSTNNRLSKPHTPDGTGDSEDRLLHHKEVSPGGYSSGQSQKDGWHDIIAPSDPITGMGAESTNDENGGNKGPLQQHSRPQKLPDHVRESVEIQHLGHDSVVPDFDVEVAHVPGEQDQIPFCDDVDVQRKSSDNVVASNKIVVNSSIVEVDGKQMRKVCYRTGSPSLASDLIGPTVSTNINLGANQVINRNSNTTGRRGTDAEPKNRNVQPIGQSISDQIHARKAPGALNIEKEPEAEAMDQNVMPDYDFGPSDDATTSATVSDVYCVLEEFPSLQRKSAQTVSKDNEGEGVETVDNIEKEPENDYEGLIGTGSIEEKDFDEFAPETILKTTKKPFVSVEIVDEVHDKNTTQPVFLEIADDTTTSVVVESTPSSIQEHIEDNNVDEIRDDMKTTTTDTNLKTTKKLFISGEVVDEVHDKNTTQPIFTEVADETTPSSIQKNRGDNNADDFISNVKVTDQKLPKDQPKDRKFVSDEILDDNKDTNSKFVEEVTFRDTKRKEDSDVDDFVEDKQQTSIKQKNPNPSGISKKKFTPHKIISHNSVDGMKKKFVEEVKPRNIKQSTDYDTEDFVESFTEVKKPESGTLETEKGSEVDSVDGKKVKQEGMSVEEEISRQRTHSIDSDVDDFIEGVKEADRKRANSIKIVTKKESEVDDSDRKRSKDDKKEHSEDALSRQRTHSIDSDVDDFVEEITEADNKIHHSDKDSDVDDGNRRRPKHDKKGHSEDVSYVERTHSTDSDVDDILEDVIETEKRKHLSDNVITENYSYVDNGERRRPENEKTRYSAEIEKIKSEQDVDDIIEDKHRTYQYAVDESDDSEIENFFGTRTRARDNHDLEKPRTESSESGHRTRNHGSEPHSTDDDTHVHRHHDTGKIIRGSVNKPPRQLVSAEKNDDNDDIKMEVVSRESMDISADIDEIIERRRGNGEAHATGLDVGAESHEIVEEDDEGFRSGETKEVESEGSRIRSIQVDGSRYRHKSGEWNDDTLGDLSGLREKEDITIRNITKKIERQTGGSLSGRKSKRIKIRQEEEQLESEEEDFFYKGGNLEEIIKNEQRIERNWRKIGTVDSGRGRAQRREEEDHVEGEDGFREDSERKRRRTSKVVTVKGIRIRIDHHDLDFDDISEFSSDGHLYQVKGRKVKIPGDVTVENNNDDFDIKTWDYSHEQIEGYRTRQPSEGQNNTHNDGHTKTPFEWDLTTFSPTDDGNRHPTEVNYPMTKLPNTHGLFDFTEKTNVFYGTATTPSEVIIEKNETDQVFSEIPFAVTDFNENTSSRTYWTDSEFKTSTSTVQDVTDYYDQTDSEFKTSTVPSLRVYPTTRNYGPDTSQSRPSHIIIVRNKSEEKFTEVNFDSTTTSTVHDATDYYDQTDSGIKTSTSIVHDATDYYDQTDSEFKTSTSTVHDATDYYDQTDSEFKTSTSSVQDVTDYYDQTDSEFKTSTSTVHDATDYYDQTDSEFKTSTSTVHDATDYYDQTDSEFKTSTSTVHDATDYYDQTDSEFKTSTSTVHDATDYYDQTDSEFKTSTVPSLRVYPTTRNYGPDTSQSRPSHIIIVRNKSEETFTEVNFDSTTTSTVHDATDYYDQTDSGIKTSTSTVHDATDYYDQTDSEFKTSTSTVHDATDYYDQTDSEFKTSTSSVQDVTDYYDQTNSEFKTSTSTVQDATDYYDQTDSRFKTSTSTVQDVTDYYDQTNSEFKTSTSTVQDVTDYYDQTDSEFKTSTVPSLRVYPTTRNYGPDTSQSRPSHIIIVRNESDGTFTEVNFDSATTSSAHDVTDYYDQTNSEFKTSTSTVQDVTDYYDQTDSEIKTSTSTVHDATDYYDQTDSEFKKSTSTVQDVTDYYDQTNSEFKTSTSTVQDATDYYDQTDSEFKTSTVPSLRAYPTTRNYGPDSHQFTFYPNEIVLKNKTIETYKEVPYQRKTFQTDSPTTLTTIHRADVEEPTTLKYDAFTPIPEITIGPCSPLQPGSDSIEIVSRCEKYISVRGSRMRISDCGLSSDDGLPSPCELLRPRKIPTGARVVDRSRVSSSKTCYIDGRGQLNCERQQVEIETEQDREITKSSNSSISFIFGAQLSSYELDEESRFLSHIEDTDDLDDDNVIEVQKTSYQSETVKMTNRGVQDISNSPCNKLKRKVESGEWLKSFNPITKYTYHFSDLVSDEMCSTMDKTTIIGVFDVFTDIRDQEGVQKHIFTLSLPFPKSSYDLLRNSNVECHNRKVTIICNYPGVEMVSRTFMPYLPIIGDLSKYSDTRFTCNGDDLSFVKLDGQEIKVGREVLTVTDETIKVLCGSVIIKLGSDQLGMILPENVKANQIEIAPRSSLNVDKIFRFNLTEVVGGVVVEANLNEVTIKVNEKTIVVDRIYFDITDESIPNLVGGMFIIVNEKIVFMLKIGLNLDAIQVTDALDFTEVVFFLDFDKIDSAKIVRIDEEYVIFVRNEIEVRIELYNFGMTRETLEAMIGGSFSKEDERIIFHGKTGINVHLRECFKMNYTSILNDTVVGGQITSVDSTNVIVTFAGGATKILDVSIFGYDEVSMLKLVGSVFIRIHTDVILRLRWGLNPSELQRKIVIRYDITEIFFYVNIQQIIGVKIIFADSKCIKFANGIEVARYEFPFVDDSIIRLVGATIEIENGKTYISSCEELKNAPIYEYVIKSDVPDGIITEIDNDYVTIRKLDGSNVKGSIRVFPFDMESIRKLKGGVITTRNGLKILRLPWGLAKSDIHNEKMYVPKFIDARKPNVITNPTRLREVTAQKENVESGEWLKSFNPITKYTYHFSDLVSDEMCSTMDKTTIIGVFDVFTDIRDQEGVQKHIFTLSLPFPKSSYDLLRNSNVECHNRKVTIICNYPGVEMVSRTFMPYLPIIGDLSKYSDTRFTCNGDDLSFVKLDGQEIKVGREVLTVTDETIKVLCGSVIIKIGSDQLGMILPENVKANQIEIAPRSSLNVDKIFRFNLTEVVGGVVVEANLKEVTIKVNEKTIVVDRIYFDITDESIPNLVGGMFIIVNKKIVFMLKIGLNLDAIQVTDALDFTEVVFFLNFDKIDSARIVRIDEEYVIFVRNEIEIRIEIYNFGMTRETLEAMIGGSFSKEDERIIFHGKTGINVHLRECFKMNYTSILNDTVVGGQITSVDSTNVVVTFAGGATKILDVSIFGYDEVSMLKLVGSVFIRIHTDVILRLRWGLNPSELQKKVVLRYDITGIFFYVNIQQIIGVKIIFADSKCIKFANGVEVARYEFPFVDDSIIRLVGATIEIENGKTYISSCGELKNAPIYEYVIKSDVPDGIITEIDNDYVTIRKLDGSNVTGSISVFPFDMESILKLKGGVITTRNGLKILRLPWGLAKSDIHNEKMYVPTFIDEPTFNEFNNPTGLREVTVSEYTTAPRKPITLLPPRNCSHGPNKHETVAPGPEDITIDGYPTAPNRLQTAVPSTVDVTIDGYPTAPNRLQTVAPGSKLPYIIIHGNANGKSVDGKIIGFNGTHIIIQPTIGPTKIIPRSEIPSTDSTVKTWIGYEIHKGNDGQIRLVPTPGTEIHPGFGNIIYPGPTNLDQDSIRQIIGAQVRSVNAEQVTVQTPSNNIIQIPRDSFNIDDLTISKIIGGIIRQGSDGNLYIEFPSNTHTVQFIPTNGIKWSEINQAIKKGVIVDVNDNTVSILSPGGKIYNESLLNFPDNIGKFIGVTVTKLPDGRTIYQLPAGFQLPDGAAGITVYPGPTNMDQDSIRQIIGAQVRSVNAEQVTVQTPSNNIIQIPRDSFNIDDLTISKIIGGIIRQGSDGNLYIEFPSNTHTVQFIPTNGIKWSEINQAIKKGVIVDVNDNTVSILSPGGKIYNESLLNFPDNIGKFIGVTVTKLPDGRTIYQLPAGFQLPNGAAGITVYPGPTNLDQDSIRQIIGAQVRSVNAEQVTVQTPSNNIIQIPRNSFNIDGSTISKIIGGIIRQGSDGNLYIEFPSNTHTVRFIPTNGIKWSEVNQAIEKGVIVDVDDNTVSILSPGGKIYNESLLNFPDNIGKFIGVTVTKLPDGRTIYQLPAGFQLPNGAAGITVYPGPTNLDQDSIRQIIGAQVRSVNAEQVTVQTPSNNIIQIPRDSFNIDDLTISKIIGGIIRQGSDGNLYIEFPSNTHTVQFIPTNGIKWSEINQAIKKGVIVDVNDNTVSILSPGGKIYNESLLNFPDNIGKFIGVTVTKLPDGRTIYQLPAGFQLPDGAAGITVYPGPTNMDQDSIRQIIGAQVRSVNAEQVTVQTPSNNIIQIPRNSFNIDGSTISKIIGGIIRQGSDGNLYIEFPSNTHTVRFIPTNGIKWSEVNQAIEKGVIVDVDDNTVSILSPGGKIYNESLLNFPDNIGKFIGVTVTKLPDGRTIYQLPAGFQLPNGAAGITVYPGPTNLDQDSIRQIIGAQVRSVNAEQVTVQTPSNNIIQIPRDSFNIDDLTISKIIGGIIRQGSDGNLYIEFPSNTHTVQFIPTNGIKWSEINQAIKKGVIVDVNDNTVSILSPGGKIYNESLLNFPDNIGKFIGVTVTKLPDGRTIYQLPAGFQLPNGAAGITVYPGPTNLDQDSIRQIIGAQVRSVNAEQVTVQTPSNNIIQIPRNSFNIDGSTISKIIGGIIRQGSDGNLYIEIPSQQPIPSTIQPGGFGTDSPTIFTRNGITGGIFNYYTTSPNDDGTWHNKDDLNNDDRVYNNGDDRGWDDKTGPINGRPGYASDKDETWGDSTLQHFGEPSYAKNNDQNDWGIRGTLEKSSPTYKEDDETGFSNKALHWKDMKTLGKEIPTAGKRDITRAERLRR